MYLRAVILTAEVILFLHALVALYTTGRDLLCTDGLLLSLCQLRC